MMFKTSLFNKGLIRSDIKRFWWLSALYALSLLLALPFYHLMQRAELQKPWTKDMLLRSLRLTPDGNEFQIALICIIPVVLAVLLFRYMQAGKSAALLHSLPCRRETQYVSHGTAGLALMAFPIILTGALLLLLRNGTQLKEVYTAQDILHWAGITLLFNLFFYAAAIFVGMFTGNSIAHLAFTYILNILPAGIYVLFKYNLQALLYGYGSSSDFETFLDALPLFKLLNQDMGRDALSAGYAAWYLPAAVLLFSAAAWVYKCRKIEAAGDIVSFPLIGPVFKYGVTLCCMLLGGAYFSGISGGTVPVILAGYVISSLLGYSAAEMLLQKTFKIWRAWKGYAVFAAAAALVLTGTLMDVTGFVRRIPEPGQVQKVYFGYSMDLWLRHEKLKDPESDRYIYEGGYFLETAGSIENITDLHRSLVQNAGNHQRSNGAQRYIIYTLKNNRHLIRTYNIDEKQYAAQLQPLYESKAYKAARFPVLLQKPETIKWIELEDNRSPKKPVILANNAEIRDFLEALRQQVDALTFQDMTQRVKYNISLDVMGTDEKQQHYMLQSNYSLLLHWLKEKGYYDNVMLLPGEVDSIVLERITRAPSGQNLLTSSDTRLRVEIKDPRIIEELMHLPVPEIDSDRTQDSILANYSVKGSPGYYHFQERISPGASVSEELRRYLAQLDG